MLNRVKSFFSFLGSGISIIFNALFGKSSTNKFDKATTTLLEKLGFYVKFGRPEFLKSLETELERQSRDNKQQYKHDVEEMLQNWVSVYTILNERTTIGNHTTRENIRTCLLYTSPSPRD